jgi:hypothetical protein
LPYLPPAVLNDTAFPTAQGYDSNVAIYIIEERWRRFYTQIQYYTIKKSLTAAPSSDNRIVNATGTSAFDRLYGESVDVGMSATGWVQPHGTGTTLATTDVEVYDVPVLIHARVPRRNADAALHAYGFDRVRGMELGGTEVVIPLSFLDRLGVTCAAGDKLVWDGDEYIVKQQLHTGYWANTNMRLYMKLTAEHRRRQSS